MEMILNSQGKFQNVNYMQYYNSFEQGMITNPVIQGVAVGGLGVLVFDNISWMYFLLQNSSIAQFGVGILDGLGKGRIDSGPYVPYLYDSPAYQLGSDIGSWLYEMFLK